GVFGIGFDVYPHATANDVSAHWNGTQMVNVTVPTSTLDLVAGVFHHARITLQHVTGGARVTVTLTGDINQTPGAPYTPITNFFIAGLNPFDCRAQFGGRTGGLNMAVDLDNCNVQFLPPSGPVAFEDFDITAYLDRLVPGQNVLALQGLNISRGSSNFLVQPTLAGRQLALVASPTYLYPPTPGAWNDSAGSPVIPSVTFLPPAGVYSSNTVAVALASSSSSARIRYTVDGSAPGTNSSIYNSPIVIAANATFRAQAELDGVLGEVTAASYTLLDSSITNFNSNLPLVIIDTLGQAIPDGSKVGAYATFIDTNTPSGRTSLRSPGNYTGRMGIGLHGYSSLQFPKKPYNLELDDESDNALDHKLLGMPAGSDWLLYPPYSDKTLLNNVISHELFEAMGHYAVRRRYVEVFLHRTAGRLSSSDYQGIYVLLERIRVHKNRVDVPTLTPTDNLPPEVTGGYLFSKDRVDPGSVTVTTSSGQQLNVLYPKPDKISQPQYDYFGGYLNAFEAALYSANWRDPLTGYAAYIDVDSFVDYHWIVEYPKNIDGVRLSNYLHKHRNGKIHEGPIWDWDLSWGNANYADGGRTNGWYYPLMGDSDDMWLRKLRTDPDFAQRIIDRWGELRVGVFSESNVLARIDQITNYLYEAQAREFACWPRLGTYVWPNPDGAAGGWDVDYVNPTSYAGIIAESRKYFVGRYHWIDEQFVPAPAVATNGAQVSLAVLLGTIYYTLDGTDPRAAGGGLSPSARLYTGTITLSANAGIIARAFHTNAWSPPARAVYVAVMPSLRITEINYHPTPPPTNSPYTEDDFEFVEVQNTGANAINLAGARIGGGISFTFSPNELALTGSPTTNNFDGGGTSYTTSRLGQNPAASVTNGPSGNLLSLLYSGTNATRNRVTFQQTAATAYDRLIADFDFRAAATPPASASGTPTPQNFDSAGTAYTLAGSTTPSIQTADSGSTGDFLRLVPATGSQSGRIAFDRTASGAFNTVIATFDFRITPPSEQNQADGFAFALLSTATYGTTGVGPSFAEEPNISKSIGVGFDDYDNASTPAEPNNNHISLHWNGALVGYPVTPSFDMSNGKFHRAQIIVSFSGNNAYVTVRLTPDINGTPGPTETVLQNALIAGAAAYESRAAFAARTGGAWASHDLDNVNVQYRSNAALASGLSLLFLPTAQFGDTGAGTTLANFTDYPLVTNTLALDLAFNPSNLVNDVSLYWDAKLAASYSPAPAVLDLDAGVFHHAHVQLDAGNGGVYATLTLTPDVFVTPGTPVNVCSNLYVPGVALGNSRIEFAARNGGLAARVDLDNVQAAYQVLAPMVLNPGEAIVVVHNQAAFILRYGTGIRIAGEFSGALNNAGDRLTLLGPVGGPILDFSYDPAWYPITDGAGFSLVAVDPSAPAANWGLAANWRPSSEASGSPGFVDPPPRVVAPVLVNEALAHPVPPELERIELYNPNPTNVDVSGWYLSDAFSQPQKYRIPYGTSIGPGGFAVFTSADFNAAPGFSSSFGLDAGGDDAWLFSADFSGQLTGYYHGYHFGASDEGFSFGRYVNSLGDADFVAQAATSFGTNNSLPLVGPVVISEIMYQPPQTGGNTNAFLEYIELQNITATPVPLYSPSLPLNTWHLRDAVQFDFPAVVVLDPGQRVLVVGFDPSDPAGLAAFRAVYPLTTNARIFGPWQGHLENSDERIELRRPGQLTAAGTVPSVLVETVHFRSTAPWPEAAAGLGSSLQRAVLTAYGNDPTNWFAAGLSPGSSNFSNQPPDVAVTSPVDGATVMVPDNLLIAAAASDADGSVVKVEFFVDGIKLGETTNAPLNCLWSNAVAGVHRLTAAARDNSGNYSVSAAVTITAAGPALSISQSALSLNLAWPSNSGEFRLHMTTNLEPAFWVPLTNTPVFSNGQWRLALSPLTNETSFYRLLLQTPVP
ncbi:MAG TPA: CotH kinase family protein, partial [Verrucomicrobiae bacterium]